MGRRLAPRLIVLGIAVVIALLGFVPLPFYLLAPGSAVDLRDAVSVDNAAPPPTHFYLTDVALARTTALTAAFALLPGYKLVKSEAIVPTGIPEKVYERTMVAAMTESQSIAAAVGERAAGYRVPAPSERLIVERGVGKSARAAFEAGDEIREVDGRPAASLDALHARVHALRAGSAVTVAVRRHGSLKHVRVITEQGKSGTQLGIFLAEQAGPIHLPRHVRFDIGDVGGSSGGLMFALDVFATLRPRHVAAMKVAGTGTIAFDGRVGEIAGTMQKIIAAKRAGATIFLCPQQNYRDVSGVSGVRVIPVHTFREALDAIGERSKTASAQ